MATETRWRISSSARRSPSPPSATGYRPSTANGLRPGKSPSSLMYRSLASSSFVRIGDGTTTCRQLAGVGSSRLPSGPSVAASDVTSSSRMASSGGFVTWAKSWVK
jgi:hypothetical protein